MQNRGGDSPRLSSSEPALRIILRRLREIMAEPSDGQSRLDKIVRQIAGLMVAEVSSIYLKRQDGSLELFATEGLNPGAVHNTLLKRGEGLVGRCAELAVPINEPDAQNHPAFAYRPETGEEIYHSFLAVPVLRGGEVLGVLTIQNKTQKEYSDEDVEVLQTTAMVLAEHLVSGAVAGVNTGAEFSRAVGHVVRGQPLSEGLALGHAVLHDARVVVTEVETEDPEAEARRLEAAVEELKASIDEMLEQGELSATGEHREVLEAYRMFAHDRGWLRRMKEAIKRGMTAEAAVERAPAFTDVIRGYRGGYLPNRRREVERGPDGKPKPGAKEELVRTEETLNSMKAVWARPRSEVTEAEYKEFILFYPTLEEAPEGYKHFDKRDHGWTKVILAPVNGF